MKETASLRRKIISRKATIGVVGQGYVGLTLASVAATEGYSVVGFDVDALLIAQLQAGIAEVPGVPPELTDAALATGRMSFTTSMEPLRGCDVVLICVPTPVRDHAPDLSYVEDACRDVAATLTAGTLVVLESTTYPGTTDDLVRPILEGSGLVAGRDFLLAYSPERIDPGNSQWNLRNTPKIVGGASPEAAGMVTLFYEQFVDKVIALSSCRAAELAKLLENTFRHVNIALVNEMAVLCNETDTDVWEVIEAAATKPFGFMAFTPGPGVGGHCIPLDPAYLAWQVRRDAGHQFRILEQAQDINAQMPAYVASRIGDALNEVGKAVKGAEILVLGVTYKPDVGDMRESPALKVMSALHRRGARLAYHDQYIPVLEFNGGGLASTDLSHRAIAAADCVAVLTPHSSYDLSWVADHARLIFDARNAFGPERHPNVVRL
ncbi:MAG TPA: nucleotide sugar dehydrogenase [Actinomycetota bacterium]|nr:nucleotide sugar dehydrogenase [Actinomycetota bacterium]